MIHPPSRSIKPPLQLGLFYVVPEEKLMPIHRLDAPICMRCVVSYGLIAASFLFQAPVLAGTLSPCGWRGTTDLRCYEESNGCFNFQDKSSGTCHAERYWPGGVKQAKPWCHANGGAWLPADKSRQLSERCSLP